MLDETCRLFKDKHRLLEVLRSIRSDPGRLEETLACAASQPERILGLERPDQRAFLLELINRIELRHDHLRINLRTGPLLTILETGQEQTTESVDSDLVLDIPIKFKRRGVEMKLVITSAEGPASALDQTLIALPRALSIASPHDRIFLID